MDSYNAIGVDRSKPNIFFLTLLVISQIFGVLSVILIGVWVGGYWGGFGWSDSKAVFNYHPLFMVLGLVFLYGDAILVYRVFRAYNKLPVKILHAVLHILALVFAVVGLQAVFLMHDRNNIPHMYSLHSWLGIIAVTIFAMQWVAGLIMFLVPATPQRARSKYLPIHVSVGNMLYLFIVGVCVSGITEKNIFSQSYSSFYPREMLGNVAGIFIVSFGAVVTYLTMHADYRRVDIVSPEHRALND